MTFNNASELVSILNQISPDLYNEKLEYIKENYELAKKYVSMDDTFATNLIDKVL